MATSWRTPNRLLTEPWLHMAESWRLHGGFSEGPFAPDSPSISLVSLPILADLHSHTSHSHGQATTQEMFLAAKAKGLHYFGFSEHSPRPAGYTYPTDYQEKLIRQFSDYIQEVQQATVRGQQEGITILMGLEVDAILGHEDFAATLVNEYPYDYIIGGLHFQGTWGFDGPAEEWDALCTEERFSIYARYYDDLAKMCSTGLFNIAAHPDLVKLHSVQSFRAWLKTDDALPRIRTALTAMKDAGMSMEISSAGLRKNCQEIYPCVQLMEIAQKLSLPITFGSDAHCANTPAYAFEQLARYAHHFGYTASTIYHKRQPHTLNFSCSQ